MTSMIVLRSPDEILIGADSAGTFDDGETVTRKNVCKIFQIDRVFYAVSGMPEYPNTGFSVYAIIKHGLEQQGSIYDKVAIIESVIRTELMPVLSHMKKNRRVLYERRIDKDEDRAVLAVAFATFVKGTPILIAKQFRVAPGDQLSVEVDTRACPGDCPAGFYTLKMGQHAAIDKYLADRQSEGKKNLGDPVQAINLMIGLEIKDRADVVGPPIDILQIGKDGARWINRKPECATIQAHSATRGNRAGTKKKRRPHR